MTATEIWQVSLGAGRLPNTASSPGCSPALYAIAALSGLRFGVAREVYADGDPHNHASGNAIDLTGPARQLAAFLQPIPQLFAAAIWHDPDHPDDSLYVWNGAPADAATFTSSQLSCYQRGLHLSSSWTRLGLALADPATRAHLDQGITEAAT